LIFPRDNVLLPDFADDNSQRIRNLLIQCTKKNDDLIFAVRVIPKIVESKIVVEMDGALKLK